MKSNRGVGCICSLFLLTIMCFLGVFYFVEMEKIETQQIADDQSIDECSTIIGPKHLGHLRFYGGEVTKTSLKIRNGNY